MTTIKIKRGLNLPLTGAPEQVVTDSFKFKTVAINGPDYVGMKPTMLVKEGDKVKLGQPLFECKKTAGVIYTSPAGGTVRAINRGEKRVFQNIVIDVADNEEQVQFQNFLSKPVSEYSSEKMRALLIESGLWTSFRTRPFSKVPAIASTAHSIFVTAIDTNPHAPDPDLAIGMNKSEFTNGVAALELLTEGKVFVCKRRGGQVPVESKNRVEVVDFDGPHPAGLPGTHIHFLDPVGPKKVVWTIGYQDVIAIGRLIISGNLMTERLVSIAGPMVKKPRVIKVRLGCDLNEVVQNELVPGEVRVISGSVLYGTKCDETFHFLTRYSNQISVIKEGREREFLGWQGPGFDKFSIKRTYLSHFIPGKLFPLTTNLQGSKRAMVPSGMFEAVMPLDILPTQLLRSLHTRDTDQAQALGALELDEEDLALCTFASTGKEDFGPLLRETLNIIEKEG
ncbi:MAG: Na(+)-translocating NADH-quinone reductase subunit A [Bdellovibrio sp.]